MLREKDLSRKYEAEAFRFYEKLWKKNKAEMERQDRVDILKTLKNYASTFKDEKKTQKYGDLLKVSKYQCLSISRSTNSHRRIGRAT